MERKKRSVQPRYVYFPPDAINNHRECNDEKEHMLPNLFCESCSLYLRARAYTKKKQTRSPLHDTFGIFLPQATNGDAKHETTTIDPNIESLSTVIKLHNRPKKKLVKATDSKLQPWRRRKQRRAPPKNKNMQ